MITVYRPDGVPEEKESVDARECVLHCGYSYTPVIELLETAIDDSKSVAKRKAAQKVDDVGLD